MISFEMYSFLVFLSSLAVNSHIVGKVVLILDMSLKAMWHFVKVVFSNATDEARRLKTAEITD